MKIKNEIENFIIYHCGSSEKDKTYLLNSLDQYIDNCHIINDVGLLNKNLELREALEKIDRLTSENVELRDEFYEVLKRNEKLQEQIEEYKYLRDVSNENERIKYKSVIDRSLITRIKKEIQKYDEDKKQAKKDLGYEW